MAIIVTGGAGFLGSNVAINFANSGEDVYVFDNFSRHGSLDNAALLAKKRHITLCPGDIRYSGDIEKLILRTKPEAVFHFAGQVAMTTSIESPYLDFSINALGTLNLLESIRKFSKNTKVLYSSTNKVYGNLEQYTYAEDTLRYHCQDFPNGFPASIPLNFESPYGCSKGAADQYLLDYHRIYDLNTVVFRHSSMYGPMQHSTFDQGWIGWFVSQAISLKQGDVSSICIAGNGKQVRDVLHSHDMTLLYENAFNGFEKINGKAFNVGGGINNSLSLLELFRHLEKTLDIKIPIVHNPPRPSDQKYFVADTSDLLTEIDWAPRVSFEDGINNFIGWLTQ